MDDRAEKLFAFADALDGQRLPWDGLWQELADVVHPRRSLIARHTITPDRSRMADAFDGTAMRANRTLANGQASRITPMGARWFALRPTGDLVDNPVAIDYFQHCGELLALALASSKAVAANTALGRVPFLHSYRKGSSLHLHQLASLPSGSDRHIRRFSMSADNVYSLFLCSGGG